MKDRKLNRGRPAVRTVEERREKQERVNLSKYVYICMAVCPCVYASAEQVQANRVVYIPCSLSEQIQTFTSNANAGDGKQSSIAFQAHRGRITSSASLPAADAARLLVTSGTDGSACVWRLRSSDDLADTADAASESAGDDFFKPYSSFYTCQLWSGSTIQP
jgi:WD40 repeat protein